MSQRHSSDAIRFDNVREGELVLTEAELATFKEQAAKLGKLLQDKKQVAKYKVEIMFGRERSMNTATAGMLSIWHSGSKFHGGGDDKLYICPGKHLKKNDCEALLQSDYNNSRGIVCPACGVIWKHEAVIGEIFFKLPMRKWAEVVYRYFRLCEHNADIYLKYAPDDIRSVALEQAKRATWQGSKKLDKARRVRAQHIYPLRNIIKDTGAGADLLGRFYAFLTA